MNILRASATVLIGVSLPTLAACGGKEAASTAAPAASAATTAAAGSSAAAGTGGATAAADDATLCRAAKKANQDMVAQSMGSGATPSPEAVKKALTDLGETLTALAATGGNSKVATAINQYGAAAAKSATAADPRTAEDPALDKAGEDFRAACKAAGVDGF